MISVTERTELANEVLRKAGWFPSRKIDVGKLQSYAANIGLEINPVIEKILSEFDEIYFFDKNQPEGRNHIVEINFAKYSYVEGYYKETMELIGSQNNCFLIWIGEAGCCEASIHLSSVSEVWFSYQGFDEHSFAKIGDWNAAINEIARDRQLYQNYSLPRDKS